MRVKSCARVASKIHTPLMQKIEGENRTIQKYSMGKRSTLKVFCLKVAFFLLYNIFLFISIKLIHFGLKYYSTCCIFFKYIYIFYFRKRAILIHL